MTPSILTSLLFLTVRVENHYDDTTAECLFTITTERGSALYAFDPIMGGEYGMRFFNYDRYALPEATQLMLTCDLYDSSGEWLLQDECTLNFSAGVENLHRLRLEIEWSGGMCATTPF